MKKKESKLLNCIKKWCKENNKISFRSGDIPCLVKSPSFLSKHCVGNPNGNTEFFIRIEKGLYKLLDN